MCLKIVKFRILVKAVTEDGNSVTFRHDGDPMPDVEAMKEIFREVEAVMLA